jgi:hypothetical protein
MQSEDRKYLKYLSILHYLIGSLYAFFFSKDIVPGLLIYLLLIGKAHSWNLITTLIYLGGLVFSILIGLAFVICLITSGIFIGKIEKYWFSFIVACASCFFYPFGTVLGVLTIVILAKDSVKSLYDFNSRVPYSDPTISQQDIKRYIEQSIQRGESKASIYDSYRNSPVQNTVAVILAQTPTMLKRREFRKLNFALITCLVILAIIRLFTVHLVIFAQVPHRLFGFFLTFPGLIIIFYLIWLVANYRGFGYLLTSIIGLTGIVYTLISLKLTLNFLAITLDGASVFFIIIAATLAKILIQALLPQTTFFMRPKLDRQGNPIFEDS